MTRFAAMMYLVWMSGTFWAFMVGLAAPNPEGPMAMTTCVAGLAFTYALLLTLMVWISTHKSGHPPQVDA